MKARFLKILITLLITAAIAFGWYKYYAGSAPDAAMGGMKGFGGPVPVETVLTFKKDLPVTISAVGTISASEAAEIRSEIAGAVKTINFSEGMPVTKDTSLIEIDDSLIRAELMKAEANYNVRKQTFARSDKLKTSGFVSKQDWEQSGGSLQEAQADIESARIRLQKAKVLAPFNGTAGLRNFSVGDYVQVGQLLTTLDSIDPVKMTFSAPEKNYADIQTAQKISFSVDAWPEETFNGEIYAVSPRINQDTRNFDVKATVPNADNRLHPGMFARITIVTAIHKDALLVPEQAIIPNGDDSFVYAVREGKAVFQKVTTGLRQEGSVEILDGLAADEPVVVAGIMKLRDGAAVAPLKARTP